MSEHSDKGSEYVSHCHKIGALSADLHLLVGLDQAALYHWTLKNAGYAM
jgi:hypothetical protein